MHATCLGLAALTALATVPIAAQTPDSAKQLPEIKVTVTRTATSLSNLGAAVTVIDSAAIHRERLSTKLDEALAYVPGVVGEDRGNYSVDERIAIRGFGSRSNFGLRGVKVLLDGVPQTLPDGQSALNNLNLSLVNRIEVLRGGASALYGNASGGVLSFTTNAAPAEPWFASARFEGGTFGSSKEEIVTGARVGTLGGTIAASRFYTDGYRQQSATDERRLNLGLDWGAAANTTFTLRFAAADDPRAQSGGTHRGRVRDQSRLCLGGQHRRGADKAVTQTQLALGMRHDAGRVHLDATVFGLTRDLENPLATPPPAPASSNEGTWNAIDRELGGARASATVDLGGPSVTGGIDVQSLRDNRTNRRSVNGVETDTLLLDQTERVAEKAAFAQLIVPLGDRVTLRGGARHDINDFSVADHFLSDGDASASRTMAATSGNGGVAVRLGSRITAWSDIATVFETPTTTELANRPDGAGGFNPDLNPQRSVTAEIGVRGQIGALAFDAAVYHTTTQDAIVPFNEVGGRTYYDNAGSTRTRGAEAALTLTVRPGSHFSRHGRSPTRSSPTTGLSVRHRPTRSMATSSPACHATSPASASAARSVAAFRSTSTRRFPRRCSATTTTRSRSPGGRLASPVPVSPGLERSAGSPGPHLCQLLTSLIVYMSAVSPPTVPAVEFLNRQPDGRSTWERRLQPPTDRLGTAP